MSRNACFKSARERLQREKRQAKLRPNGSRRKPSERQNPAAVCPRGYHSFRPDGLEVEEQVRTDIAPGVVVSNA
jgi:hypothetical protein